MFPETLHAPLPQSVADVEQMGISGYTTDRTRRGSTDLSSSSRFLSFRRGKSAQAPAPEAQPLTGLETIELAQENLRPNRIGQADS